MQIIRLYPATDCLRVTNCVHCRGCQPQQLITDNYSGLVHQSVGCVCVCMSKQ